MLKLKVGQILKDKNLTSYWLSKQTGIAPINISKIVNGETKNIRFDTIEKICKALDCSINDLFESDDPTLQRLLTYTTAFENQKNSQ